VDSRFAAAVATGSRDSRAVLGTRQVRALVQAIAPLVGAEAPDLVAAYLDQPRHWPSVHAEAVVTDADWNAVLACVARRAAGAPMQYAVGKASFRSLTLAVDERVLIPRPETELLVDLVLQRGPRGGVAVDVGTGSGAIAIALATEGHFDRVIATDISLDALDVARANALACGAKVDFQPGDLLAFAESRKPRAETCRSLAALGMTSSAESRCSAIVSNPPYIAFDEADALPAGVRDWEPALALYSSQGGLAHTRRLVAQAAPMLQDQGLLALEVDARRASLVAEMVAADDRYAQVSVELDLTGRERFVLAVRRNGADS